MHTKERTYVVKCENDVKENVALTRAGAEPENAVTEKSQPSEIREIAAGEKPQAVADPTHTSTENVNITDENKTSINEDMIICDSGCSSHMFKSPQMLDNLTEMNKTITLADNSIIKAEGVGAAEICGNDDKTLKLKRVLLVPKLTNNLLSVTKLVEDGKSVTFDVNGGHILDSDGREILTAKRVEDLFAIIPNIDGPKTEIANNATEKSWGLWHKRLGHINTKYMSDMKKFGSVYQFDPGTKIDEKPCETCIQAKFKRKPFKRLKGKQSNDILNLLHLDLIGPLPLSFGQARYIFMILDDFSKKMFPRFLKTKSETLDSLKELITELENQTQWTVKIIRSDCGTEYLNHEVAAYCKSKGIKHQLTTFFSPSSNGQSEIANRHLVEGTRALLIDSEVPIECWAEAAACWSYVKNRTPNKSNKLKTPEEIFTSKKPSVGHLKVFGCKVYYWIVKHKRESKFHKTAEAGLFMGYSSSRKAFRILNPLTKQIVETRDAIFLEGEKGSSLLKDTPKLQPEDYIIYDYDTESLNINPPCEPSTVNTNPTDAGEPETTDQHDSVTALLPTQPNTQTSDGSDTECIESGMSGLQSTQSQLRSRPSISYYESPLSSEDEEHIQRDDKVNDPSYKIGDTIFNACLKGETPRSYKEALRSLDFSYWKLAMDREINSLKMHDVWEVQKMPDGFKSIPSKWVYKKKINPVTGNVEFKARLVGVGMTNRFNYDFGESYSPVLKYDSLRVLIAVAVQLGYEISHLDIETAYLYSKLDKVVYMNQPEGYETHVDTKNMKCKLNKSIYGLPPSGRLWNETLSKFLKEIGFKNLNADKCIFELLKDNSRVIVAIYVDDILVLSSNKESLESLIKNLQTKFKVKDVTKNNNFLGIEIIKEGNTVTLTQRKFVEEVLQRFQMDTCHGVSTPMDTNVRLDQYEGSKPVDSTGYQQIVGALMYLCTHTRPDICLAITTLSRYNQNPRELHMTALKRVLKYLKQTKNYCITYRRGTGNVLTAYADAAWRCGRQENDKSITGFVYLFNGNIITWSSKTQSQVALSTCDAETSAVLACIRRGIYLELLIEELMRSKPNPTTIFCDNKATIFLCTNGVCKEKSQHLIRTISFISQQLQTGKFVLKYIPTEFNNADFLTKGLPNLQHNKCLDGLKIVKNMVGT